MISFNQMGNLGHLGNQMFQYASLKGISKSNNTDFMIPPKENFGKNYNLFSNINYCFELNCERGISNFDTLVESKFSFDSTLMNGIKENVNLQGYFQTEKYFKHIENDIRKDFSFSNEVKSECLKFIEKIDSKRNIISLHIRRNDYVNLQEHHPLCTLEYYTECLEELPNIPTLIFSDDSEWCLEQDLFNSDRFLVSQSNSPYMDMCLMTLCNYHIIANSSFSWWGAWLSNSKKVFAPKQWFGKNYENYILDDLYCDGWIVK
jgi:hypothetical protein